MEQLLEDLRKDHDEWCLLNDRSAEAECDCSYPLRMLAAERIEELIFERDCYESAATKALKHIDKSKRDHEDVLRLVAGILSTTPGFSDKHPQDAYAFIVNAIKDAKKS